ncbi:RadB family lipoprotein [Fusobacterium canifelinum]|uniref:Stress response protein Nst1 n=1 Tax=Fusobacterium canifelinum TaxID=285729 RepID=A0A3P1URI3_9FUSO|nr:RadB family lipoprotein [Fusobacterium canifelinum]RRD24499.1 hypothetical protein EII27_07070 [Fusobacterium canifelinum]
MKKGIFAMFILLSSMAMVACTNANATNEVATGERDAFQALEKRREYYKEQDKKRAKMEAEAKKAEEQAMKEAENQMETTTEEVAPVTVDDAEARKAEEKAMKEAAKAKEAADKEALKILEKKRKGN